MTQLNGDDDFVDTTTAPLKLFTSHSGTLTQAKIFAKTSPTTHYTVVHFDKIVSDELFVYFETYVAFWALLFLSCFGLITNSLNVIVFMTQGFKDGANISMMAITFWDLVKCFTGLVHRMYGPISLAAPGLATSWRNITFIYVEYTPVFASYVSYALATYVSVERCLCVSKPFTVKSVFTPKFTITMVTLISCVVFGAYLIIYFIYEIAYQFSPYFNETVAICRYNAFYYNHEFVVMLYYKCVAIILPFSSFVILCLSSLTTLYFLRQSSRFLAGRELGSKAGTARFASGISQREKQVAKVLLTVVIVNIGNLFPRIVFYVGQLVEPEFYVLKRYHNFFMTVAKFLFILDFTNASVNFFIFFSMSTAFRATFYATFGSSKCAAYKK